MTREDFMMKKTDIETRMHQTRIDERNAIKAMTLQFEDRLQDEQLKFRKLRNSIMEERDMKRVEIENEYKQRRRELWAEDCELVDLWRAQLGDINHECYQSLTRGRGAGEPALRPRQPG